MKILMVGNMGYVGPVLTRHLRRAYPRAELIGFDAGLFAHCLIGSAPLPEVYLDRQVFGDVRHIDKNLFEGVDAVVNLAAISNDPMGIDLRRQHSRSTIKPLWNLPQRLSRPVFGLTFLHRVAVSMAVPKRGRSKNLRNWIR